MKKSEKAFDLKEIISKIRETGDRKLKEQVLEKYFADGCRYAVKIMNNVIYTDLINPSYSEISSLVYQAFEKTIKNLRVYEENKSLSFKNFFYLMIKYQIFADLKTTLNYRVVPNFSEEINKIKNQQAEISRNDYILTLDTQEKFNEIKKFLETKSIEYVKILLLKMQGYKNKEICKILALTSISLKSRLQYIRKLVREQFGQSILT